MLELLGFQDIVYSNNNPNKISSVNPQTHPARGYILAKEVDVFGRVIGFVFPHTPAIDPTPDGSNMDLTTDIAEDSINGILLKEGWVHPALYNTLPDNIIEHFALLTRTLRTQADPNTVWPTDTASKDQAAMISSITDMRTMVIWPKLFRRLVTFFTSNRGANNLQGFIDWLKSEGKNDQILLKDQSLGNLSDVIRVNSDGSIQLTEYPEDLTDWQLIDRNKSGAKLSGTLPAGDFYQHHFSNNILSNNGDSVFLLDSNGEIVDQVSYSKAEAKEGYTILFS